MNFKVMGFTLLSASLLTACSFPSGYRAMNQLTYGEPVRKVATVNASPSTPYRYATVPVPAYRLASRPTYPTTRTAIQAGPVISDPTRAASPDNPVILGNNSRPAQTVPGSRVVYQADRPSTPTVVSSSAPTPYTTTSSLQVSEPIVTLQQPAPLN